MKLALTFACLVLSSNFSSTTVAKQPTALVQYGVMTMEEERSFELVNAERWSRGLGVLKPDPLLVEVARAHSREMAEKDYFDHTSPTPGMQTAMERFLSGLGRRPKWAYVGENLFYCSIVDVNRGHEAFMNSHSHRDNIINPKFERLGVGVYQDKDGQFWVTQMFMSMRD